jgi:hypothetical protein
MKTSKPSAFAAMKRSAPPNDTLGAVTADVAVDLAAAGRVPDVDCIFQVQRFDECRKVIRIRIHVVAGSRLIGTTMAAAVMCDTTITAGRQKEHLVLERIT